jgi:acyl carrier protein
VALKIMSQQETLKTLLGEVLQIDTADFDADTQLLGALPEFDSMAVVMVLTQLEETLGLAVADDEIDAEVFETLGSLTAFVEAQSA